LIANLQAPSFDRSSNDAPDRTYWSRASMSAVRLRLFSRHRFSAFPCWPADTKPVLTQSFSTSTRVSAFCGRRGGGLLDAANSQKCVSGHPEVSDG